MRINRMLGLALATSLAILPAGRGVVAFVDDAKPGITDEGYLTRWLVLAPIPLEDGQEGGAGIAKEQVKDESGLKPKAGDKVELGGKEYAWKAAEANDDVLNFNEFVGSETPNSVAYAVCVIIAEEDRDEVALKVGSDDQVRVYLNGKLVHTNSEARAFEKDEDSAEGLALKKGRNVVVMKVVNEGDEWSGSLRVVDKQGAPIKGLRATIEPE